VVAHDPVGAARRTTARDKTIEKLLKLGQHCSVKLDDQDESQHAGKKKKPKGRPMSDSGTKARFYHAVKDAHMAHVIKVVEHRLFSYIALNWRGQPLVSHDHAVTAVHDR
jgi:hypothetical protein